MNITFVLPLSASGGTLVLQTHARLLASRGHRVVFVSPPTPSPRTPWNWLYDRCIGVGHRVTIDGTGIEHRTLKRWRPVVDADVPEADVVVATWWETVEWVARLGASKGRKVHFVQGHEVYPWLPQSRAHAVHRLPLHRIVISRWLADIMRTMYGDEKASLVYNGVDHECFRAPARGKQTRPTVGLLFSETPFKGFDASLAMLTDLQRDMPTLRVLAFGFEAPRRELPPFLEFVANPPRDMLRSIYASCDVWLTASSSEGFNMPAIEAMACRTPVVAFQTGWPAEAVVTGVDGACVEVGDFQALKSQTRALLSCSDNAWRRQSQAAYAAALPMTWERSSIALEAALAHLTQA